MKAIMLMFDSLNKRLLSAYGSDRAITPNFQRLKNARYALIILCWQYALYACPQRVTYRALQLSPSGLVAAGTV